MENTMSKIADTVQAYVDEIVGHIHDLHPGLECSVDYSAWREMAVIWATFEGIVIDESSATMGFVITSVDGEHLFYEGPSEM